MKYIVVGIITTAICLLLREWIVELYVVEIARPFQALLQPLGG